MARILIAEDHEDTRELLSAALRGAGHETIIAADGDEALQKFIEQGADLVLIDIFMPGRDGTDTIRELRKKSSTLKIIAMSAGFQNPEGGDYGVLDDAIAIGADLGLRKPLDPLDLMTAGAELLGLG